tara:strand:+ start:343 stop:651 length:309 start_codon:yes stop_codon:yes gene_type:complete
MPKNKAVNFSKEEISKQISNRIGFSQNYIEDLTDDLISVLKTLIKNNLNIKNFGTFKIFQKNERIGRNPRTKVEYKIRSRKSISFTASKKIQRKINSITWKS